MKQSVFAVLCLILSGMGLHSMAQESTNGVYTLEQCISLAIKNNMDVQQSELDMQTGKVNLQQARFNRLPDLNAFVGHGINQGRSIDPFTNAYINQRVDYGNYNVSSGVTLFNGLALHNAVKQNEFAYEAARMDWQQAKDNLTLNIILGYLQVLSNEDLLLQQQNQAELTRKQVERLEVLNKNGSIAPYLLTDLKGQLASDELTIINSKNNLETARINLCQLMNIPYDKNMKLEKISPEQFLTKYDETSDKIYETALERFALVRAAYLRTKSAEKQVKVAKGLQYPVLGLNGSATSNISSVASQSTFINSTEVASDEYVLVNGSRAPVFKQQNNFVTEKLTYGTQLKNNIFTTISLNLSIPIFNNLFARNRVKLAQISLKSTQVREKTMKTRLQQNIEQAYANMTAASERHKTLIGQVEAFEESFRSAEIRFNEGVGNSIDYLTAKNNRDRADINLIIARYDYLLRTKILDYYQGKN